MIRPDLWDWFAAACAWAALAAAVWAGSALTVHPEPTVVRPWMAAPEPENI